jgi:hypothetical protein
MDGMDLRRRIGWLRTQAKLQAKLALLWQRQRRMPAATAAECQKLAREPLGRLEGLRRHPGTAARG